VKIPESGGKWILSHREKKLISSGNFCVLEKVHGANFCFVYDTEKEKFVYGKRKEIIACDDEFFGYKQMLPETEPKIERIVRIIEKKYKCSKINIYGELFGNGVQTGVYYSDGIHFYAFDVSIFTDSEQYLDYDFCLEVFESVDILHAKPLFVGTYEEAINFELGFETVIPSLLKRGMAPSVNNKAEGIVVKPLKEITVNNGRDRAIVKIKIPEFSESKYDKSMKHVKKDKFDYYEYFLTCEIDNLLTVNRLNNVKSKIGMGSLIVQRQMLVEDIESEFVNNDLWGELSEIERKNILKETVNRVEKFIVG